MNWHLPCAIKNPINILETKHMKSILVLTLSGIGLLFMSCNTMAGAGQDMQQAGDAMTNAARDAAR